MKHLTDLLQLEDVIVEVLLQVFVRIIDAELLEAIYHKVFETKYV